MHAALSGDARSVHAATSHSVVKHIPVASSSLASRSDCYMTHTSVCLLSQFRARAREHEHEHEHEHEQEQKSKSKSKSKSKRERAV
jgi:hypothetical protein